LEGLCGEFGRGVVAYFYAWRVLGLLASSEREVGGEAYAFGCERLGTGNAGVEFSLCIRLGVCVDGHCCGCKDANSRYKGFVREQKIID
jgi:hypothetical protein